MSKLEGLPDPVIELLQSSVCSEFATVSAAGVPIDTPMLIFASEGLTDFNVATGLAYPAKAERARKNPKVGLLFEGRPDEPVVAVAGLAAVKDSDLQANTDRYIAETGVARVGPAPWPLAHKAVWYWTRMLVSITPVYILWWKNAAAMDGPPNRWDAPKDTIFPKSDPAPSGSLSASPKWPQRPWRDLARDALASGFPGHLTLCDAEGYPLPIRVRSMRLCDGGFLLELPDATPWQPLGTATLTFAGRETFVGSVAVKGRETVLEVERALPINPFVGDNKQVWEPHADVYEAMMGRLRHEVSRRGQSIPVVPEIEPEPSAGAKLRLARAMSGAPVSPLVD